MPKAGPRKLYRYSDEFKAQAVRLSALPGVQVQEVAHALAIHPTVNHPAPTGKFDDLGFVVRQRRGKTRKLLL